MTQINNTNEGVGEHPLQETTKSKTNFTAFNCITQLF